jgi:hypothetical protein
LGDGFRCLALEKQQVQLRRLTNQAGQDRMDLAAVMGLVVEPVRQRRCQFLLELLRRGDAAIFDRPRDPRLVQPLDIADNAAVFRHPRGMQFVERLEQDGIEPVRRFALPGEPLHPDPVGCQQMIERAVHRFEESATVGTVLFDAELARRIIQPAVGPFVVAGKHPEMGEQGHRLTQAGGMLRETTQARSHDPIAQPMR